MKPKRGYLVILILLVILVLFINGCLQPAEQDIQKSSIAIEEESPPIEGEANNQAAVNPPQQEATAYQPAVQEPKVQENKNNDKFIVANPFDLSKISAISKFRSCAGHDYSGLNANGEKETQRSMKHYLNAADSVVGSNDKVKVYAPFDGKIASIDDDFASFEGKQRGQQIWLSGESADDWVFVFFHVDLLQSIKKDTRVKAGQHIGYANFENAPNFDFTLKKFGFFGPNTIESPFLHLSQEVVKLYTDKGLAVDNFVIQKNVRDAKPCTCTGEYCFFPTNSPESNPEDWVVVK
ncbi:hypothetical protein HYX14_00170 [Candidatus Woesearchaeota archaeon]|nr:hypothetical protein [Candidatus Woesearchaeota archaeon]